MPVMNGLQAAPQLRKLLPGTRIILYTLYADGGVLEHEAANAGIDLVLSKGQDISILVSKAHELMGSK